MYIFWDELLERDGRDSALEGVMSPLNWNDRPIKLADSINDVAYNRICHSSLATKRLRIGNLAFIGCGRCSPKQQSSCERH